MMTPFNNLHETKEEKQLLTNKHNNINYLDELKQMKVWVCWNYIEKDGHKKKMPCSAFGTVTGTNLEYGSTWVTFEEAKKAACANNYSGVGFVIPKGWFFLDIDHKPLDDPYVVKMLERFGSYAEKSVSGEGIHIYGNCDFSNIPTEIKKGKLKLHHKYYQKNPNNDTELYIGGLTNRFAVFTEDVIQDKPIKDCTEAVLETLEKEMLRKADKTSKASDGTTSRAATTVKGTSVNANTVIQGIKSQKNREKFIALFEKGDTSKYNSNSEADLALCNMIAFRAGPNPELIDEVFRQSQLYREKWKRDDYREETIEKAIEGCNGKYYKYYNMPSSVEEKSTPKVPDFIRLNSKGNPRVHVPALARYVRENTHYLLVKDNAYNCVFTYVYENGVYKLYDKNMFMGVIRDCIETYNEDIVKMSQIEEAYKILMTERNYICMEELNNRVDIINFKNGLLKVTENDLVLTEHDPNIYSTIQLPCCWTGEKLDTPFFQQFMSVLTNKNKDVERLLMQFIGVCLSNVKGHKMKRSLFLLGPGDTGKSQLKCLVEYLLGEKNYSCIGLDKFEKRFGLSSVYGKRLAGSADNSCMQLRELNNFKMVTGGDRVEAEFKGKDKFKFRYNGLLWFCMNRLPKFGGDNGKWVYDRIMIVRCPNVIPKEKQDKNLIDKMKAERDGIIFLAVKALQQVMRNGFFFDEPECVIAEREKYTLENNTALCFFNECMTKRAGGRIHDKVSTGKVFNVYKEWCKNNYTGFEKNEKEFRDSLCEHIGATFDELTKKSGGYAYYMDYTLTEEIKLQYNYLLGNEKSQGKGLCDDNLQ